ncbi:MAG: ATP12 family chaperone protein [Hyphomicrobiaceae bacterium]
MSAAGNGTEDHGAKPPSPGREAPRPLPRRFYREAGFQRAPDGFVLALDGRPARTPGKSPLALPNEQLAAAVAAEWTAQGDVIDPQTMPLTRMCNTAIDGVAPNIAEVAQDIVAFAGSDLVCYRAEQPEGLVDRQAEAWNAILVWAEQRLDARFVVGRGIMPIVQPGEALSSVARHLADADAFRLTGLHVMTTLTGSALIALATADGAIDAATAWKTAHVDEDWQISQWGEDAEAMERREGRWQDMQAASRLVFLAKQQR